MQLELEKKKRTELHENKMSDVMRKPFYAICEQQRRRSACASAQSNQRLCFRCLDRIIPLLAIAEIARP